MIYSVGHPKIATENRPKDYRKPSERLPKTARICKTRGGRVRAQRLFINVTRIVSLRFRHGTGTGRRFFPFPVKNWPTNFPFGQNMLFLEDRLLLSEGVSLSQLKIFPKLVFFLIQNAHFGVYFSSYFYAWIYSKFFAWIYSKFFPYHASSQWAMPSIDVGP